MTETFRNEYVRCGKAACRSCPHGPYWYAYWREGDRVKKRYVGKVDPRRNVPPDPDEQVFKRGRDQFATACRILGISTTATRDEAYRSFRKLSMQHHPDRGGDGHKMAQLNEAWAVVRRERFWK